MNDFDFNKLPEKFNKEVLDDISFSVDVNEEDDYEEDPQEEEDVNPLAIEAVEQPDRPLRYYEMKNEDIPVELYDDGSVILNTKGQPISREEKLRRFKLSDRMKYRKSPGRPSKLSKELNGTVAAYTDDIVNESKKFRYEEYLEKVRNKTLSLDDLEAVLHVMIAEQFRKPERNRDSKLIVDASAQIRQITDSKRRIEESQLSVSRDQSIMNLFEQWARILKTHIQDVKLLNQILFEFKTVLDKTIDVKNINRTIENGIQELQ